MRKPKIELYWVSYTENLSNKPFTGQHVVNWRLIGANGELMCSSNQGFRDKTDAIRSVESVANVLTGWGINEGFYRVVGPGRKPK